MSLSLEQPQRCTSATLGLHWSKRHQAIPPKDYLLLNSVHTRRIVKTAVLQGAFVKIGDFIKPKGFLVEYLENRRS